MSEADFTDSTAPMASPAFTTRGVVGSSTKTTSPRAREAKLLMPIVALGEVFREKGKNGGKGGLPDFLSADSSIHSWAWV